MHQLKDGNGELYEEDSIDSFCRHTICYCGHITDNKLHDCFAMQQFTTTELEYLEKYMLDNYPNNLINGRIKRLRQHSDNASQHFKSTGALQYFTSLINKWGGPSECMYVYSFGAPGHGKGVFESWRCYQEQGAFIQMEYQVMIPVTFMMSTMYSMLSNITLRTATTMFGRKQEAIQ